MRLEGRLLVRTDCLCVASNQPINQMFVWSSLQWHMHVCTAVRFDLSNGEQTSTSVSRVKATVEDLEV